MPEARPSIGAFGRPLHLLMCVSAHRGCVVHGAGTGGLSEGPLTLAGMNETGVMAPDEPVGLPDGGLWWWPRRRSLVLDASLAVISAVECAAKGVSFVRGSGLAPQLGVVLGLLVGASLLLRRRCPIAVVLIALAVAPAQMGIVLGVVSLYTL